MITWPALEHAAQQAGWRRKGKAWRGPCPLCGGRKDRAWVAPGATADFVAGCNAGCDGLELARALVPDSAPPPVPWRVTPRRTTHAVDAPSAAPQAQPPPGLPDRVWRASEALQAQPGAAYLTRRGLAVDPWPAAVRWLSAEAARRVKLRPSLPAGAAGAILYHFAAPSVAGTCLAVQAEAVNAAGARVPFTTAGKRPSVSGSTFTHGARVFLARDGGPSVALCESVLDALAVGRYPWGAPDDAAVIAGAGTSGFTPAAVAIWPGPGPVTIWAHGDGPGARAALALRLRLETAGRAVTMTLAPHGMDWGDVAQQDYDERAAIQKG